MLRLIFFAYGLVFGAKSVGMCVFAIFAPLGGVGRVDCCLPLLTYLVLVFCIFCIV